MTKYKLYILQVGCDACFRWFHKECLMKEIHTDTIDCMRIFLCKYCKASGVNTY